MSQETESSKEKLLLKMGLQTKIPKYMKKNDFFKSQLKKIKLDFFIPDEMKIRKDSKNDFKVWLWKCSRW